MNYKKISENKVTAGFTIVEVMIVLAIAGLIILIVFLAVPALQRNSRNNARNQDAARVAAAVNECMAARNAIVASCDDASEIQAGNMARLDTITFGAPVSYSQTEARVLYNFRCNAAGDQAIGGGGAKAFALTYQLEPNINRCIEN